MEMNIMGLEKFGYYDLCKLAELIQAYANSGKWVGSKCYAELPATWYDNNVCPNLSHVTGGVILTNSEYQVLTLTDYGLMEYYFTRGNGFEGTLFDLADQLTDALIDAADNILPAGANGWNKDDLIDVYCWLDACIPDLAYTDADTSELIKAKNVAVKAIMLEALPDAADRFVTEYADWADCLGDADRFESEFYDRILCDLLDDHVYGLVVDNADDYAEFLRVSMLAYLNGR